MDFKDLVIRNRSTRRFQPEQTIMRSTLLELVDLARQSGSARNLQPLKYFLSWERERNRDIFSLVKWAGYLKDWNPAEVERPRAYIILFGDRTIGESFAMDAGIAAQTILLGAVDKGLSGCMLGSFQGQEVRDVLGLPEHLEPQLILALGVPAEQIRLEQVGEDGSIRYWRDEEGVFHVPKRSLDELVLN